MLFHHLDLDSYFIKNFFNEHIVDVGRHPPLHAGMTDLVSGRGKFLF